MPKLVEADIYCIKRMKKVNKSNCETAHLLGVTEGAVRYRIKKANAGQVDGRSKKKSKVDKYHPVIDSWLEDNADRYHKKSLKCLFDMLTRYHGYSMSYDALRRYVRKHFPQYFKRGSCIRMETPPGELMFFDWKEDIKVQMMKPGNWRKVQAACFTLGFSRKPAIIFSYQKDLESFISAHQQAFIEFGGLPVVIRTDCLKSAVTRWRGGKTVLNKEYGRYLEKLDIAGFPARPGKATDKGKVEKRIRDIFSRLDLAHRAFKNLEELECRVREEAGELEKSWRCGSTGLSVQASYAYEKKALRPLPKSFPLLPVKESRMKVRRDGTVYFGGNYYQVPGIYRDRFVLCQNTGKEVIIYHDGKEIARFEFLEKTKGMVMLSEEVLSDADLHISDTVRDWGIDVAKRQCDIYHEIIKESIV